MKTKDNQITERHMNALIASVKSIVEILSEIHVFVLFFRVLIALVNNNKKKN